ncbi:MAG: 5-formyltetrahydrofolate cyclo-ligase [Porticoccaceae bacterium]
MNKEQLRQKLRSARHSLSPEQQALAGQALLRNFLASEFSQPKRAALYLAADGEIDPTSICAHLWAQGAEVFLPRLNEGKMSFAPYREGSNLTPNKYGIPEPDGQLSFGPKVLDLILMPLVGFDDSGNRLGMGGGFYDRTLAEANKRPRLIGLAHECQRVGKIEPQEWDIPLDAVITDQEIYRFNQD